MKNCIVNKQMGEIQKDNPFLGQLLVKCHVNAGSMYAEMPASPIPYEMTIIGEGKYFTLYDAGRTQVKKITSNVSEGNYFDYPGGDFYLSISNKYNLTLDGLWLPANDGAGYSEFNIDDVAYISNFAGCLENFLETQFFVEGNVSKLNGLSSLKFLNFKKNAYGNLSDIAELSNCRTLYIDTEVEVFATAIDINRVLKNAGDKLYILGNQRVSGNISALVDCTKLTYIHIYETMLEGDLDALFTAWSNAGKTGDCYVTIGQVWSSLQHITGARTSQYFLTSTPMTVTFNGDGTWSISV